MWTTLASQQSLFLSACNALRFCGGPRRSVVLFLSLFSRGVKINMINWASWTWWLARSFSVYELNFDSFWVFIAVALGQKVSFCIFLATFLYIFFHFRMFNILCVKKRKEKLTRLIHFLAAFELEGSSVRRLMFSNWSTKSWCLNSWGLKVKVSRRYFLLSLGLQ